MRLFQSTRRHLFLIILFVPILAGYSNPVAVKLKATADLTCNKTCNGAVLWTNNRENLEVFKCVQERCTQGDGFKNRVSLSAEKIKHGTLSLTIHPSLYNDEGWYEAYCDSAFVCRVYLEVFVPNTVNASIGNNITLSCYARTEKNIADNDVNIMWKREGQIVLQVKNGITYHGSGFAGRASSSLNHYREGDLSLTILRVTPADKGLYRCYHKTQEEHGHPGAITLNIKAHQHFLHKRSGDNLTLNLFSSDPVTVTFNKSKAAEMLVCNVKSGKATCSPGYNDRVSVLNYSLVLHGLTAADFGTFTVKDQMGEVVSVNTVTVEGLAKRHHFIAMLVPAGFVLFWICLIATHFWCPYQRKMPTPQRDLLLEISPASYSEPEQIGLSEQETGQNNISVQPLIPRAPIEETTPLMPVMTTEKQDNTAEERSTHPVIYEDQEGEKQS